MINFLINIIFAVFQICCIVYTVFSFIIFIGAFLKQSKNNKIIETALCDAVIADYKKSIDDKKIN